MSDKSPRHPRLGYLTSVYARASDSFIRGEVLELRRQGFEVFTFSVRKAAPSEHTSEDIKSEARQTIYLLEGLRSLPVLAASAAFVFLSSPVRAAQTFALSWRCSGKGLRARFLAAAYFAEAARLAGHLKRLKIAHLHNHIGEGSAVVALLASRLTRIPYSLTLHGPFEFDRPKELHLGEKIAHAKFVVAISHYGKGQLSRWCRPEDLPKIHVVRCGLPDAFFEGGESDPAADNHIVSVGRLSVEKGHRFLLEALAAVIAQGVEARLTLIGDGPHRSSIESDIRRLNLQDHVKLTGWQSADAIRQELISCKLFALPSLAEGLPVVIMEALALNRPVLTTYIAGIPELVEDGVCGWLAPSGSTEALAVKLREALSAGPDPLRRMGHEGRERVRRQHHQPTEVRKLARLFLGQQP